MTFIRTEFRLQLLSAAKVSKRSQLMYGHTVSSQLTCIIIHSKYFFISDWLKARTLLDLQNSSHPTQPHSTIAKCVEIYNAFNEFYHGSFVDEWWHNTPIAPCKGIYKDSHGFWIPRRRIPDSRYLIPVFVSGTQILDSNLQQDSGFLELYSGFQSPGFRIPQAKLVRIPIPQAKISQIQESGFPFMGRHQSGFAGLTEWPKRFR